MENILFTGRQSILIVIPLESFIFLHLSGSIPSDEALTDVADANLIMMESVGGPGEARDATLAKHYRFRGRASVQSLKVCSFR